MSNTSAYGRFFSCNHIAVKMRVLNLQGILLKNRMKIFDDISGKGWGNTDFLSKIINVDVIICQN